MLSILDKQSEIRCFWKGLELISKVQRHILVPEILCRRTILALVILETEGVVYASRTDNSLGSEHLQLSVHKNLASSRLVVTCWRADMGSADCERRDGPASTHLDRFQDQKSPQERHSLFPCISVTTMIM
jgi:hypothetical protein